MKLYKNLSTALKEREQVEALKISLKEKTFPTEIFDFPNLRELYLEGATESFPDQIMGWKNLKTVSIKWENFKGSLSQLFSLPQLENLKVIETPLKTLLLPLGKASAPLKFLTLKNCGIEKLPEELSMLTQLSELTLPNNSLSELPRSFFELQNLKRLNLDQNEFSIFPDAFKKMPKLTHLSIDGNKFSEEEKERIQRESNIWVN